ncbi:TadE/TadG family type IV pilus assembly protein [Roseospira navarrensis]|nr:TadE/TadG family type IV pilus assembly protein [Roseospira navarrensis]
MQALKRRRRNLRTDSSGGVAIEFALVIMPVLMVVFAIFEIGIMTLQSVVLHGALEEGARQLRTGQVQKITTGPTDQELAFRTAVCDELFVLLACDDVKYDVRGYASFSAVVTNALTLGADGMPEDDDLQFAPGGAEEISVARVYSRYRFTTPFLDQFFNDSHGSRLISFTAVVKGEPWN